MVDSELGDARSLLRRGLFRLFGRLGNGKKGNIALRGHWEGKRKGAETCSLLFRLPIVPPDFQFPRFSTEGASAEDRATLENGAMS